MLDAFPAIDFTHGSPVSLFVIVITGCVLAYAGSRLIICKTTSVVKFCQKVVIALVSASPPKVVVLFTFSHRSSKLPISMIQFRQFFSINFQADQLTIIFRVIDFIF